MKKLMLIAALVASVTTVYAQRSEDAIKKALENAKAACENPKKAGNPATWLNYAKVNMEAYNTAQGNGWLGANRTELQMIMASKPTETITEAVGGRNFTVDVYPNVKYYFNEGNSLQMIVVTKPFVETALEDARAAFEKAAEIDVKGSKTKDILEGLKKIADNYQNEAMNAYSFGDLKSSSDLFMKAVNASATKPLGKIDSSSLYNSGLTAFMSNDFAAAKEIMTRCIEIDYFENGDAFAKLADCEKALGDTVACKTVLEEGFEKCPDNQGILIGLINLYLDTNDDPGKLFSLLDVAKKNEPSNASLYYVEGNIHKQLGEMEEAIAAYEKCSEVNPDYEFGYIGAGLLHWEEAVKIQEQAETEYNDAKYQALVDKFDATLEAAIPYFENAFNLTKDNGVKTSLGEYLKNIYFRFRDKGDEYQANYDKYNDFVKNSAAE